MNPVNYKRHVEERSPEKKGAAYGTMYDKKGATYGTTYDKRAEHVLDKHNDDDFDNADFYWMM